MMATPQLDAAAVQAGGDRYQARRATSQRGR